MVTRNTNIIQPLKWSPDPQTLPLSPEMKNTYTAKFYSLLPSDACESPQSQKKHQLFLYRLQVSLPCLFYINFVLPTLQEKTKTKFAKILGQEAG